MACSGPAPGCLPPGAALLGFVDPSSSGTRGFGRPLGDRPTRVMSSLSVGRSHSSASSSGKMIQNCNEADVVPETLVTALQETHCVRIKPGVALCITPPPSPAPALTWLIRPSRSPLISMQRHQSVTGFILAHGLGFLALTLHWLCMLAASPHPRGSLTSSCRVNSQLNARPALQNACALRFLSWVGTSHFACRCLRRHQPSDSSSH